MCTQMRITYIGTRRTSWGLVGVSSSFWKRVDAASRRGSVTAQTPYLNQGNTSEAAKFDVLGLFNQEKDNEKEGEKDL